MAKENQIISSMPTEDIDAQIAAENGDWADDIDSHPIIAQSIIRGKPFHKRQDIESANSTLTLSLEYQVQMPLE